MLKVADLAFLLILLSLAVLQLNDPDPVFWFGLYSTCALGPLLTLFRGPSMPIFWVGFGLCLAGVAVSLGGGVEYVGHIGQESLMQEMSPDKPYVEEAREVIGTLIALSVISVHFYLHRRQSARQDA